MHPQLCKEWPKVCMQAPFAQVAVCVPTACAKGAAHVRAVARHSHGTIASASTLAHKAGKIKELCNAMQWAMQRNAVRSAVQCNTPM